jgi:hypothetical protein
VKTRDFDDILREVEISFDVHEAAGTHLGGVHFELDRRRRHRVASAAACPRPISPATTSAPATRALTYGKRWRWPSGWPPRMRQLRR